MSDVSSFSLSVFSSYYDDDDNDDNQSKQILCFSLYVHHSYHPSCTIPCRAIEECQSLFTMFYNARYEGRKLIWATQYGTADIKANYASGKRDLNVSTYQMAMLSLFNDKETYTLQEIATAVDIEDEMELKRHLLSLCTSKHRILIKSSKAKGIHQDDTFTYNEAFTSRLKRIKGK